jgi:hypothetical protein
MLHWTNNLKNRERVDTRNYGGLSRIGNWNGRFPGMTEGVQAHIQHLKGYANERPRHDIVDPRYQLAVDRGFRGMKFEDLYSRWMGDRPYREYERSIEAILVGIGSSGARR